MLSRREYLWMVTITLATSAILFALTQAKTVSVSWSKVPVTNIGNEILIRPSFRLDVIRCDGDHLTGLGVLTRYFPDATRRDRTVVVNGFETNDGRFWPAVTTSVADHLETDWRPVITVPISGKPAQRRVRPQTPGEAIFVSLDAFRAEIGKARFGRVSVENGEYVIFLLDDLRAPEPSGLRKWFRNADQLIPAPSDQPFLTRGNEPISAFRLVSVSGSGELIEGQFHYGSATARPATDSEWAGFADGNYWPAVKAQVANDDRSTWDKLGLYSKPEKEYKAKGAPEAAVTLRVDLAPFAPLIGKYRYGRVVLETGESAIFELANLLPPGNAQ